MTWEKGKSGNPNGRPPGDGSKAKFVALFWRNVQSLWKEKGADYLVKFADADPGGFCRMAAMLVPKDEVTKQISHQIEVTLKTPAWLTHEPQTDNENEIEASDRIGSVIEAELITED